VTVCLLPPAANERGQAAESHQRERGGLRRQRRGSEIHPVHHQALHDDGVRAGETDEAPVADRERLEVLVRADVEFGAGHRDGEVGCAGAAGVGVQVHDA